MILGIVLAAAATVLMWGLVYQRRRRRLLASANRSPRHVEIEFGKLSANPMQINAGGQEKFIANKLVTGQAISAAHGLADFMGIDGLREGEIKSQGLDAIRKEFQNLVTTAATPAEKESADTDLAIVKYILDEPASRRTELSNDGHTQQERDVGHEGLRLADFVERPEAVTAKLNEAHIAALRIYSSKAYGRINFPLRSGTKPHPCAATTLFVAEALRKLRAEHADTAAEQRVFWRGMKDLELTEEFVQSGGTELGCMSTSTKQEIVADYAQSQQPLVFCVVSDGFMSRGADISWLSLYSAEAEVLYPPLTYLKFVRKRNIKNSTGIVVDVKPEFSA
jgi:hypothetical protein